MAELSPADRDTAIRTILGEAANQPDEGQVAIGHVLLNRLRSGDYGSSLSDIALAPHQFEAWQTRPRELLSIKPTSEAYQRAAQNFDNAVSGTIGDPTNNATHYLNPDIVIQRQGSLPAWANGPGVRIGGHVFFAPEVQASPRGPAGSLFKNAGFDVSQTAAPAAGKTVSPPSGFSLFKAAGFALPGEQPAPQPASNVPTPERWAADAAKYGVNNPRPGMLDQIRAAIDPMMVIPAAARSIAQSTAENFAGGNALAKSGLQDVGAGRLLPTFPSSDPQTWTAGGALKTVAGGLGALFSPISGAINALVEKPVTEVTGNPDIGSRAGAVVSAALPLKGATVAAKSVAPSTRATNALVQAIGPENVSSVVQRLRTNPRLSVMDVSDPVRTMAQGLIDPAQPKAQNVLAQAVKDRTQTLPGAVNSAYTAAMGPAPDVVKMVAGLKERAQEAGRKAIQPALANAKPVDVSPVIDAIDKTLKPGIAALADPGTKLPLSDLQAELVRFKSQLTDGNNVVVDPKRLHDIQSNMGDMAFQLSRSSDAKQRWYGGKLRDFNEMLIDQIDTASGGTYRPARAKFKEAKDISAAFDAGFDTLKNRQGLTGLQDRPEALRDWVNKATDEEIAARQLGTRSDIDQKIRGVKNQALAGENITKIEYNREKLAALFGDKEATRLTRTMEDAAAEAHTNAKLLAGAKTAETLAGQRALEVPKVGGGNPLLYGVPMAAELIGENFLGTPGVGFAGTAALGLAHRGVQKVNQLAARARNVEFAKSASAVGPARERVINQLLAHSRVQRAMGGRGNPFLAP